MTLPHCEHCPFAGTDTTCPRWPTMHTRYCEWVDPASPSYRPKGAAALRKIAAGRAGAASFPPLMTQARGLAVALGRFVMSGGEMTTPEERARRLSICHACEHFAAAKGRCRLCGCAANLAARVASKHCPDDPPRW